MSSPISSFQGLASGVQWRDLIDQIIQAETARSLTPVTTAIAAENARIAGWGALGAAVAKARDALAALTDASAFRARTATVGTSVSTGRTLASVTNANAAAAGRYSVEVENLAQAEKLTGLAVADAAAALGVSGRVIVNGVTVSLDATDSLTGVRDKLNAANRGTAASGVSATISTSNGVSRLILTADRTGTRGIELAEDRSGAGGASALEALGLVDATRTLNVGADGGVRSARLSSATLAVATALGIPTFPSPATIVVNGRSLTVDLTTDSLSGIVARINALSPGAARIETETEGATTWSRIAIAGTLAGDGSAEANHLLEALGMRVGGRAGNVAQSVSLGTVLTGAGGATATGATLLTDLGAGTSAGVQAGDMISLSGTDGNGSVVQFAYTVTGTDTVDDLLGAIEGAFAGGRAVDASIVGGKLVITDGTGGDSRLAFAVSAGLQSGGTLDFGAATTTFGRVRQLAVGEDARVRVDGAVLTSRTNTIVGAFGGATLTLQGEEDGTAFDVLIASTPDTAVTAVQNFATAYNELRAAVAAETKAGGRLRGISSARAFLGAMNGVLVAAMPGLGDTARYTRAGAVGLALQRDGSLKLDETKFRAALATDTAAVEALFASGGTPSDSNVQYVAADKLTPSGVYALAITQVATRSTALGAAFTSYAAGATPAAMTITSEASGRSATLAFVNGDTPAVLAARLQAALDEASVGVSVVVEGGALRLTSSLYGSVGGFTVSYADAGGEDPGVQLGLAAGAYDTGVDAQGTLDGIAMTGSGQVLTGANGLMVRYAGSTLPAASTVNYTRGLGGALAAVTNALLADGDGTAALQQSAARARITTLQRLESDIEARLGRRRAMMIADFARMEALIGKLQGQGAWLSSQIASMNGTASR